MDILSLINASVKDVCFIDYDIYMPKGSWARFFEISRGKINIKNWKLYIGNEVKLEICYIGKFIIKAGRSHSKKSFKWIYEKELESEKIKKESISIDLSNVEDGILEITMVSLAESALFRCYGETKEIDIISEEKNIIQNFLAPTYDLCCEEPLYFRFKGKAPIYSFEKKQVLLNKGEMLDLYTYFNSFSIGKWFKYTNLDDLSIFLEFEGKAYSELYSVSKYGETVIGQWDLESRQRTVLELPIDLQVNDSVIGLKIYAKDGFVLYGGGYLSRTKPLRKIKLGICITTFKREKDVSRTVKRLLGEINNDPRYKDAIDIIVVDNGSTLHDADVPGATLIRNRNFGGTGGFMRGLLYCKEKGGYTHCLFMDDDANCEVESIFRAMSFISHGKSPKLALTGAMLYESVQFLQWENGAWFDGGCHSVNRNLDLRLNKNLLINEQEPNQKIYGAWWFFMFPISAVQNFSFPYFVRGDDIDFSYNNNFIITTLNGVAAWQEDFKTKESPLTVYLFIRSHILHHMNIEKLDKKFSIIDDLITRHFHNYNDSYDYATAACVNLAIRHVLKGPDFWRENMEPKEILKQISEIASLQSYSPTSEEDKKKYKLAKPVKAKIFPYLIRTLSLNGHLLPTFLLHNTEEYLPKEKFPGKTFLFTKEKMTVIDNLRGKKTIYPRSVKLFFKNLIDFYRLKRKLKHDYDNLSKNYQKDSTKFRNIDFWKDVYGK